MNATKCANCVILGGGGHARVLIDCLITSGAGRPQAVLDSDRSLWGRDLLGVPVVGSDDRLSELAEGIVDSFAVGLGATADNAPRRCLYDLGVEHGLHPLTVVHPRAICSALAEVGPGCQILAGSVVNTGAVLGCNVLVNSGAIVEHDCLVGDHGHVATGARLAGAVRVGAGAHIGIGATVRQGISIGEEAIVGAGAVVVKDVAPRQIVVGVPARALKK